MTDAIPSPVILLDWSQTLSNSRFWGPWFTSDDAIVQDLARRMADAIFARPYELLDRWCFGAIAAEEVVDQVAAELGIDPALALEGLERSCREMQFVSPEILPLVEALRAHGVRVGIATDNMDTFTRWTVPAMGLERWFDPILNSADLAAVKSGPLDAAGRHPFFGDLLDRLEPGTCVFLVDDSATTGAVVEPLGVTFCHVTPDRDVVAWLRELATELLEGAGEPVNPLGPDG